MPHLGLYILSQVFGVLALVSVFVAYQIHNKRITLLVILGCNIFMLASAAFLLDWIVVAMSVVGAIRCAVFYFVERYREKITKPWMYVILVSLWVMCCVAFYFTWATWFDFVVLATWLTFIYGTWVKGVHLIRITNVVYSTTLIIHYLLLVDKNYLLIITEISVITSIAIFYISKKFNNRVRLR